MEEQVGELWHKLLDRLNDKTYPEAKVELKQIKSRLLIYFKALTHDSHLTIELADKRKHISHRNWLQKIAGSNRSVIACWRDENTLYLPAEIAFFENAELNKDCYFWLAGMSSLAPKKTLVADNWLQYNQQLCSNTLKKFGGLKSIYKNLVNAHIKNRPAPISLNKTDARIEQIIREALLFPDKTLQLPESGLQPAHVPLWLYQPVATCKNSIKRQDNNNNQYNKNHKELQDMVRKKAHEVESTEETTGLITVRMENIFSWGEHAAVDRSVDDEEELDKAEDAARDMNEIAITQNQRAAASRLKFDLDLPSASVDDVIISNGILLPEWNYKKNILIADQCRIIELELSLETQKLTATNLPNHLKQTVKKLKNQFQALAPARIWHSAQQDGQEIDTDRWLRFITDKQSSHGSADHLFKNMQSGNRDMCCTLLADLSLSTDTWLNDNDRIIDVIRDALLLFGESLQATGDPFSMLGFSSRKRDPIRIHQLKRFSEKFNGIARGRINAIKPGYYTRLGAAIRYSTQQLIKQPQGQRLLLILTDGKPNDLDQYEGRYGIEDTRQSILEARREGIQPFCVTIDMKAGEYLPYLFGSQGYVLIKKPVELPKRLPLLYAQLTHR